MLAPFDDEQALALIQRYVAAPDAELVERISVLAGGIPFAIAEMARRAAVEPAWAHFLEVSMVAGVGPATRDVLQRVAVVGAAFDTDEFVALSGLDDAEAYDHLERALAARVIEPASSGYRFRHRLVRDALLEDVPPHRRRRIHADAAAQLSALGASPARIGHHLLQAGDVNAAVPHLLAAAEVEAAVGAYRDSLELVDSVRPYAAGAERARLLALRADLLMAIGDPTATAAYREALDASEPSMQRRLRARLARAAVMSGDLDTADAALAGLEPDGSEEDGEILLAQGHLAFYSSDFERAWDISETARQRVLAGDKNWQVLDLIALQGLLAHNRGVWFEGMRAELRRTRDAPEIANAVFDGYLCPAEYLLYGPTPYADVIEIAGQLRSTARRSGALRAVAFATALAGEAALLSGDLPLAATELQEAVDLHHDLGSAAGEAHSLQRLAEVRLAEGDLAEANRLAQQALPLARWSMIAPHLLQRIYGTMIAAAPDPMSARAMVDRAESTFGVADHCNFCSVMLAVPAAVACVDCGDLDHARSYLEVAEGSAKLWDGTAWEAAVDEAKAHLAVAEGEPERALELLDGAARRFDQAGQPLDRDRCRRMAEPLLSGR